MMKQLAIASVLAIATAGLATSASAGYGHKHHGFHHHHKHHFSYGYKFYKPRVYYKPVYVYRHYKPVCGHYGWVYRHGHKVWGCIW